MSGPLDTPDPPTDLKQMLNRPAASAPVEARHDHDQLPENRAIKIHHDDQPALMRGPIDVPDLAPNPVPLQGAPATLPASPPPLTNPVGMLAGIVGIVVLWALIRRFGVRIGARISRFGRHRAATLTMVTGAAIAFFDWRVLPHLVEVRYDDWVGTIHRTGLVQMVGIGCALAGFYFRLTPAARE